MHKILMVAGESSGDLLGAHLYQSLKAREPKINCFGMGGHRMQEAGVNILVSSDNLGVVGGIEVIKHLSEIRKAYKTIKNAIKEHKPTLVILIDYPGFNLRLARFAKNQHCKVFYYVSPQIWAWRYRRIHHIKKYVDHMAVLFSFEEKIYQNAHVPVSFVGHPITEIATTSIDKNTACDRFHLKPSSPVIALLPGSRKQEVAHLLPIMMQAVPFIQKTLPDAQFILPLANSLTIHDVEPWIHSNIRVIERDTYNALAATDAAIAVSGTVTLEIALLKVPFMVIYKMSPISFKLAKRLIKVPFISLCNLVGEGLMTKELIQNDVTPEAIAEEIVQLIQNKVYRKAMINNFNQVAKNLGQYGASDRTAAAVLNLLK